MIALTFALPAESSDFVRLLQDRSGRKDVSGRLHGTEVRVLHTGVGQAVATARVRNFLAQETLPQLLITTGFAGGLTGRLQIADLLLAENFSAAESLEIARRALGSLPFHVGKLATATTVLDSPGERSELGARDGALAVDMETEFIAAECRAAGVATLSLRAITDTPALPFPVPPQILFDLGRQRTDFPALALYLTTHPLAIGKLIAFARRVTRARGTLTRALDLLFRAGFS